MPLAERRLPLDGRLPALSREPAGHALRRAPGLRGPARRLELPRADGAVPGPDVALHPHQPRVAGARQRQPLRPRRYLRGLGGPVEFQQPLPEPQAPAHGGAHPGSWGDAQQAHRAGESEADALPQPRPARRPALQGHEGPHALLHLRVRGCGEGGDPPDAAAAAHGRRVHDGGSPRGGPAPRGHGPQGSAARGAGDGAIVLQESHCQRQRGLPRRGGGRRGPAAAAGADAAGADAAGGQPAAHLAASEATERRRCRRPQRPPAAALRAAENHGGKVGARRVGPA
mmetsp:Transcript_7334/g.22976  ORF Transcript_7334/g.22976 Transcript_7334/m.22976 type:complete len:285 (+) Transcript_7334:616-1470(+)